MTTQVEDCRGQLYSTVPHQASVAQKATGEARGGGPATSEAVGRVGDPVRRLLLGALGRAVAGEDGLVGLGLLTVCNGPLQGPTWGLANFPRSTPVSC